MLFFIRLQNIHGCLNQPVYFMGGKVDTGFLLFLLLQMFIPSNMFSMIFFFPFTCQKDEVHIAWLFTELLVTIFLLFYCLKVKSVVLLKKCFIVSISWYSNCSVNSNFVYTVDSAHINEMKTFAFLLYFYVIHFFLSYVLKWLIFTEYLQELEENCLYLWSRLLQKTVPILFTGYIITVRAELWLFVYLSF